MWALRRASASLRKPRFSIESTQNRIGIPCVTNSLSEDCDVGVHCHARFTNPRFLLLRNFHKKTESSPSGIWGTCRFSSHADTKTSGGDDDDLEDGFSDLDSVAGENNIADINEESDSESDLSEEAVDELEHELEDSLAPKTPPAKRGSISTLFKKFLDDPTSSVDCIMTKWKNEGNEVTRSELTEVMMGFRRRRMFMKALKLSEWMETSEEVEFTDRDYASRVDLIAKTRGIHSAESYLHKIPKEFCGELAYRALLANCVYAVNVTKSEKTFNKMKELGFPISSFAYNQLLLLYKKTDKKKIADVLLLMDKSGVDPSRFTYKILIDVKGQAQDIEGMEKIIEAMSNDKIEPTIDIKASIAKYYISSGNKEKAEAVITEMEGENGTHPFLLSLYASLGKAEEVNRIWQLIKSKPRVNETLAAIRAWGSLKKFEEAEEAFDTFINQHTRSKPAISKAYHVLLSVYADNKMLEKGKELAKKMAQSQCPVGPLTWDALVQLYCNAGEVEGADSILKNAATKGRSRPLYRTFHTLMEQYAKKGDVHNCEKIFYRMRQAGYVSRFKQFETLLRAYLNAKAPAYGMVERMKADNIFPNKALTGMLTQVDAFRPTALSDIFD